MFLAFILTFLPVAPSFITNLAPSVITSSEVMAEERANDEKIKRCMSDLKSDSWLVRFNAISALGEIGPATKDVVPALIKVLGNGEMMDCWRAAEALGNIGPAAKDAVPALIKVLGDGDGYIREKAAEALGDIGPAAKDAVPALIKALKRKIGL